jgi:hypothetical protein
MQPNLLVDSPSQPAQRSMRQQRYQPLADGTEDWIKRRFAAL